MLRRAAFIGGVAGTDILVSPLPRERIPVVADYSLLAGLAEEKTRDFRGHRAMSLAATLSVIVSV